MPETASFKIGPSVQWDVYLSTPEDTLFSPDFYFRGCRFRVEMTMDCHDNEFWCSCMLRKMEEDDLDNLKVVTYIKTGIEKLEYVDSRTVSFGKKSVQTMCLSPKYDLYHRKDDPLFKHGVLKLVFMFGCIDQPETGRKKTRILYHRTKADMGLLIQKSGDTDVLLRCGGQNFPAHRTVLSAQSEVFAAMFRSEMLESQQGVVDIVDMKPSVLNLFLQYVYSGNIDEQLTMSDAPDMYRAADKYVMYPLRKKCSNFMAENMAEDSVIVVLLLSHQYEDRKLMDAAVAFVLSAGKILRSADFKKFSEQHPHIACRVYREAYERASDV